MRYLSNIDLTMTYNTKQDRCLLQFNSFALFEGKEYFYMHCYIQESEKNISQPIKKKN